MKNIKDFNSFLSESMSEDEKEYLSPKQRKLPEGLKKGIIARNKKAGKKAGDKEEKEKDKE